MDLATEKAHLAQAERDIAQGEQRITRQMLLIDRMRRGGHDVSEAEKLLQMLRDTMAVWQTHREDILMELARIAAGAKP